MATPGSDWLGKLRGHVKEAKARFSRDAREREEAGRQPQDRNIILTEREVRGEWDASRVLMTTLNGQVRPITADDLAAFRQNMRVAQRRFGGKSGITPRQIIDMASSTPLRYLDPTSKFDSDIDKARREITYAMPVSAINGEVRFITNAGPNSKVSRHHVTVKLLEFDTAAARLAATATKDKKAAEKVARWLRKQKVAFDCDCERHRYFFRYVATIGGFAAGRQETGYPKIRNPKLHGVACKHVLRTMTELESSGRVLGFLTRLLENTSEYKSRLTIKQKEADQELEKKRRPTAIKTSEQRRAEAQKRRDVAAAKRALQQKDKEKKVKKVEPGGSEKRLKQSRKELQALMKRFNLTPEQIIEMLGKQ